MMADTLQMIASYWKTRKASDERGTSQARGLLVAHSLAPHARAMLKPPRPAQTGTTFRFP